MKLSKELIRIFAFDSLCLLKDDKQSKFIYHLSRLKWIYKYLTFKK